MGFWNFLKEAGTALLNDLQERNNRILELKEKYEYRNYDDEKLQRIYSSSRSSIEEKMAAGQLLHSRRCESQDED